jgi:NADH-quinone oxidoreductase subunit A
MAEDYLPVFILLSVAVLFAVGGMFLSFLVRPYKPTEEKVSTYECGEKTIGKTWAKFNIRFYTFLFLFVIFDVEVLFLYPFGVKFKDFIQDGLRLLVFIEILIFILILVLGLVYAWRKDALKWM